MVSPFIIKKKILIDFYSDILFFSGIFVFFICELIKDFNQNSLVRSSLINILESYL